MLSRLYMSRVGGACIFRQLQSGAFEISPVNTALRTYARDSRTAFRTRTKPTLWEKAMAPVGPNAYGIGKGAVAGASAIGVGALCFYGLGLSSRPGALEQSHLWPQYVKDRIKDTYLYFGGSIAFTAASAMAIFRSPTMMNIVARSGWMAMIGTFAAMIGSGMLMRGIEYKPGVGPKQFAWMLHSAVIGGVLAPMCFLGGPLLVRAAWYTAGIVGGLSTVAVCAPSGEFLTMGAPLAMGLGVVFASSVAGMFLPATSVLGAGLHSMALYGGLVIFSGLLVYDTQKIIKKAETHPPFISQSYDPINAAMSIYMDTINIFVRIASILAGGGNRRN